MYYFIINSHAKSKLGYKIWLKIENYLDEQKISYRKYFTKEKGHATEVANKISANIDESSTIVVLGGDGTLNEVVNGLQNIGRFALGYIPIGSSNDFARGMNIHTNYLAQLKKILNPQKYCLLDYGQASYNGKVLRFLVSSGIGYDATVCHEVNHTRLKTVFNHFRVGKLIYGLIAVKQLSTIPYNKVTLTLDENQQVSYERVLLSAVHVQKFEGGGYMFCPDADPCDGYLDICIVEGLTRKKALLMLPGAKKGKHTRYNGTHIFRCRKAEFTMRLEQYIHIDGETEENGKFDHVVYTIPEDKIKFIVE